MSDRVEGGHGGGVPDVGAGQIDDDVARVAHVVELVDHRSLEDVQRLLVIRRMKPLGFTLDEMRALRAALDRIAAAATSGQGAADARGVLAEFHRRAEDSCARLRTQLAYAEELTTILGEHATGA
ncbi:MerR family DNA-binding protein [Rhodococcus aetherivorans]|uniref:MerR family DNA-binding protein n=1 Tax=Rhodococcus aetherivorans TaxID=191292 RepID=UPI002948CA50|nr:MerR family DNA-binding protein [Rhodococcus aetherivorans]MDV6295420.1 MerR family DNA-binding protein [Rhodococcus aetherivorans]